jgi:hypothetical protein
MAPDCLQSTRTGLSQLIPRFPSSHFLRGAKKHQTITPGVIAAPRNPSDIRQVAMQVCPQSYSS